MTPIKYFTPAKNNPPPFKATLGTVNISRVDYNLASLFYGGNFYSIQRDKEVEDHLVFNDIAKCVVSFQVYKKSDGMYEFIAIPRLHFTLTSPPNGKEDKE